MKGPERHSPWWERRWVTALAICAAVLPLALPVVPPLADLPGHMASYHVSIALDRVLSLQRFYGFDWHLIGNLGADLLSIPLAMLFGVELGTKILVLATVALTALALLLLARQGHRRFPPTAFAALPIAYNSPFLFGFINYSISAALALLGLAAWIAWPSDRRPIARAAAFAAFAVATWLAHAIGWMMLGAMCAAVEAFRQHNRCASLVRRAIYTATPCLTLAAPVLLAIVGEHADKGMMSGWLSPHAIGTALAMILRDHWAAWDLGSVALLFALVGAASLRLGGLRLSPVLACPAAALLMLLLLLPLSINGSYDVNTRVAPYALGLAVVAIDTGTLTRPRQAWLAAGSMLFLIARLTSNGVSSERYDDRYRRELAAIAHITAGAKILNFVEMPCRPGWHGWRRDRLEHLAGLATVRKDAFVNVLWTIKGLQLLRDRMPQLAPFSNDPSQFVSAPACHSFPPVAEALAHAPVAAFDYVWLIGVPPGERPADPRLRPVWEAGQSVLYRTISSKAS